LLIKKASAFEMHEALVACSENKNHLSRKVDTVLQRKFGKKVDELLKLGQKEFKARFDTMAASGDLPVVLWAAAANPGLSDELRKEIFGEVHMTMHWSGEQRIKMSRRQARLQKTLDDTQQRLKDVAQKKRALEKENARLIKNQAGLEAALKAAKDQKKEPEAVIMGTEHPPEPSVLEQENHFLKTELEVLYRRFREQQSELSVAKGKNERLASQLASKEKLNHHFQEQVRTTIAEMVSLNRCNADCPSFDLCKKRILIVGGITRMESLYRDLIEGSGGILDYHDGYMKSGTRRLESRLKRADMVLCPVSCNSHTACSVVKNLAKKHKKTVYMLANSSLKTISQAIWGTDGGNRNTVNSMN
jgi:hypothetical protein